MTQAALSAELYRFIVDEYYAVPAPQRRLSHWVMDHEWLGELKKMTDPQGLPYWEPGRGLLLGLPYMARANGGTPHLEPDAVPRSG